MDNYDKRPLPNLVRAPRTGCEDCRGKGFVPCDAHHPDRMWVGMMTVRACDCTRPVVETR